MIDLTDYDIADAAARDPSTRSTELLLIAQLQPALQPIVAAHPNSDAVVLEYLAQTGDTEVNEVLARRAEMAQTGDLWQEIMKRDAPSTEVVATPPPRLPRLSRTAR